MCSPHLRSEDLGSTLLKQHIFINYWKFYTADLSILPSFMIYVGMYIFVYLFNDLFMSVWTHEYLFYSLGYNRYCHYLFCCPNHSRLGIWQLLPGWLRGPFSFLSFRCCDSPMQDSFTALNTPCATPIHPPSPRPRQPLAFLLSP